MKKMMKNLMVLLLMVAAAYGTKPKCQELTDTVVLKDDADICEVVTTKVGTTLGNPNDLVTLDFSQADETTLTTLLAKFNKVAGAIIMDGNEHVAALNFGSIATFDTAGGPGDMFMLIRNNPKLETINWHPTLKVVDHDVVMLVYNNPLLDATSLETLRTALNGKNEIKPHIQNTGECQFEHPLDPADPAKYIAPTAKFLENCKTIKGDFVVKDTSLAGLGNEIQLDPSGCLKLINVDMKGVKLAASNYTGTGACKDGTMSEITGNPNLCGAELEKLHSSYGNNTAVKADPATCTVPCTPDQQSSQGIYFFCLPATTADPTTTTEPSTNTTNPAAALIGQPKPDPPKDNTEKSFTMEPWMIGTIVVCAVVFLILIGVLGYCWWKKKWCCCRRFDDPEIASDPKKVDADKEDKKLTSKEKPGSKEEAVPGNRVEDHVEPHVALVMDETQPTTKTHTPVKPEQNEDLKSPDNLMGKTKAQEDMVQKPVEEKETKASKEKDDPVKFETGTTESEVNVVLEGNKKMTPKPKKEEQPDALDDHGADLNVEQTQCSEKTQSKEKKEKEKSKEKPKNQSKQSKTSTATLRAAISSRQKKKFVKFTSTELRKWKNVAPELYKEEWEILFRHNPDADLPEFYDKPMKPFKLPKGANDGRYKKFAEMVLKKGIDVMLEEYNREDYKASENRDKFIEKTVFDNGEEIIKRWPKPDQVDTDRLNYFVTRGYTANKRTVVQANNMAKLKDNTYVHANKVEAKYTDIYCAEAPITNVTIERFWTLIRQQGIKTVIMLCQFLKGRCADYLPPMSNEEKVFGEISLKCLFVAKRGNITHYQVEVTLEGESHIVNHFKYEEWPDHKVPVLMEEWLEVLYLIDLIALSKTPSLVHCFAGIGRTGSFVSLVILMEELKSGDIPNVNEAFKHVRRSLASAIQTAIQYFFLYALLLVKFLIDEVIPEEDKFFELINELRKEPAKKKYDNRGSVDKVSKETTAKIAGSKENGLKKKTSSKNAVKKTSRKMSSADKKGPGKKNNGVTVSFP